MENLNCHPLPPFELMLILVLWILAGLVFLFQRLAVFVDSGLLGDGLELQVWVESLVWGKFEPLVWGEFESLVWGELESLFESLVWGEFESLFEPLVWGEFESLVWGEIESLFESLVWGEFGSPVSVSSIYVFLWFDQQHLKCHSQLMFLDSQ